MNEIFPIGRGVKKGNIVTLAVVCGIYLVAAYAMSFVAGVFSILPLVGWIVRLAGGLFKVYCAVGIVLAVLDFFKNK
ncbi:hypothetical protein NDGK_02841 [Clostridiales bacterium CHKCI001]|nr:hypothetical protein NDGK_02841 [Clostridiales bacterium CHKCI001]